MSIYNKSEWVGKKYGKLTVLGSVNKKVSKTTQWFWEMRCDCGKVKMVKPLDAIVGRIVSCGCYRKTRGCLTKTHGMSHTRLHNIWCGMNNRCDPNHKNSERYGGRGITICEEWVKFENFRDWSLANGYREGLTIERIDVNGDYCPQNCKWIEFSKQARNRTTTKWVTYMGREMSLAEAAEIAGLPYKAVHYRIKKLGWSVEKALSEPMRNSVVTLKQKCDALGLNYHSVYTRISSGWTEEEAFLTPFKVGNNQLTERYKTECQHNI